MRGPSAADAEPFGAPPELATLILVDDDVIGRELLRSLVEALPGVRVVAFGDSQEALAWCRTQAPDVVIANHRMPGLTGTALIELLRRERHLSDVPVMMVTASEDRDVRLAVLEQGANDVLTQPVHPAEVRAKVRNMLAIRQGQRLVAQRSSWLEREVTSATATIAARERETILRLSRAAEYRDWATGAHIVRVSLYARLIARHLALAPAEREVVFHASPMHDVGKVGVPDAILLKPGSLDDAELAVVKRHTVIGHEILSGSGAELLQVAAEIALTHHERFDGAGYPDGRQGEAIPLCGRIVAVADTFDALASDRPYKVAWPAPLAWAFLEREAGARFDPACVRAFRAGQLEAEGIRAAFPDRAQDDASQQQHLFAAAAATEEP